MFNKNRILTTAICATALLGGTYSATSVAATANGTATAIVIAPLTIVQGATAMDFGTVSPGLGGGTVTVDPASAVTVGGTATQTGAAAAGDFDITGQPAQAYTITFGAGVLSDGINTMVITADSDNSLGAVPVGGKRQSLKLHNLC